MTTTPSTERSKGHCSCGGLRSPAQGMFLRNDAAKLSVSKILPAPWVDVKMLRKLRQSHLALVAATWKAGVWFQRARLVIVS
jgi:hypothetical protein